jgi:CubicO group peptidase (beta-lactamase class C family)
MNTLSQTLPQTAQLLQQGLDDGLHIGAQIYVSQNGTPLVDDALGEARPNVPMAPETLMPWYSSGKPLTVAVIAQLWEQGYIGLDDPVYYHLPDFQWHGKEAVTIRHLLTHTAGFRNVLGVQWHKEPWADILFKTCGTFLEPGWAPGAKAGYHPASSWFILAEIACRRKKRPFSQIVRQDILEPLHLHNTYLGMPPEQYRAYGDRIGQMHNAPETYTHWETEEGATLCRPGGGARGPIRELGHFYEALLTGGTPILEPETVTTFTHPQRKNMVDHTFQHIIDWGLGFIVNSNHHGPNTVPYSFGLHASPDTFGHGGIQSSAAFADPKHNLVVALVCNGMPGELKHNQRARALHSAIYEDLGLV